jgi:hypothetical protein
MSESESKSGHIPHGDTPAGSGRLVLVNWAWLSGSGQLVMVIWGWSFGRVPVGGACP